MDDAAASGRLSDDDMAESLVFYRRRLAAKLAVALIERGQPALLTNITADIAAVVEDLANAICERLAARETGDPRGYQR